MTAEYFTANKSSVQARLASDVVMTDGWGLVSGVQPVDLNDDRVPLPELVEDQTKKILANLDVLLKSVGLARDQVVAVRISLVDFKRLYDRMNAAYGGFFPADRLPARSCVGVSQLTRGALVEMDFTLRVPRRPEGAAAD